MGLLGGSAGKESACNIGDLGLLPGLGRSPGGENGYPLQLPTSVFWPGESMDCIVHLVTKNQTRLSIFSLSVCVCVFSSQLYCPLKFQSRYTYERASYGVETSPSQLPPQDMALSLDILSPFTSFVFCPTSS